MMKGNECLTCGETYPEEKMNGLDECKACAWGENRL